MGESVLHIGQGAFAECTSLASITIPESSRHLFARPESLRYLFERPDPLFERPLSLRRPFEEDLHCNSWARMINFVKQGRKRTRSQ